MSGRGREEAESHRIPTRTREGQRGSLNQRQVWVQDRKIRIKPRETR